MELINTVFKRAIKGNFQLLYCLKAISHSCYLLGSSCKMVCKNYSRASWLAIGLVGVQALADPDQKGVARVLEENPSAWKIKTYRTVSFPPTSYLWNRDVERNIFKSNVLHVKGKYLYASMAMLHLTFIINTRAIWRVSIILIRP